MVVPLVFFGAGASSVLDIPSMGQMVPMFLDQRQAHGEVEGLYKKVVDALSQDGRAMDIEAVFSVVEALAHRTKVEDLGHPATYLVKEVLSRKDTLSLYRGEGEAQTATILLRELEDFVRKACRLDPSTVSQRFEPYKGLFGALTASSKVQSLPRQREPKIPICYIYTTNYDRAIEQFFMTVYGYNSDQLSQPFSQLQDGLWEFVWDDRASVSPNGLCLIKLHGSVDWSSTKDGRIIRDQNPYSSIGGSEVTGRKMLYPLQQKDLYLSPWTHLFRSLRLALRQAEVGIFVGYRFGDPFVRAAIQEAFAQDLKKRLLILNPEANEIAGRLGLTEQQVIPIPNRFGDQAANDEVRRILDGVPK